MTYPVANFLIQIKNAYMANKKEMNFAQSRMIVSIGKILKEEGFIKDIKESKEKTKKEVTVTLLYKGNYAAIQDVKIISKPSVHKYIGKDAVKKSVNRFNINILSTNQGVMSNKKAVKMGVGGELLAKIS